MPSTYHAVYQYGLTKNRKLGPINLDIPLFDLLVYSKHLKIHIILCVCFNFKNMASFNIDHFHDKAL